MDELDELVYRKRRDRLHSLTPTHHNFLEHVMFHFTPAAPIPGAQRSPTFGNSRSAPEDAKDVRRNLFKEMRFDATEKTQDRAAEAMAAGRDGRAGKLAGVRGMGSDPMGEEPGEAPAEAPVGPRADEQRFITRAKWSRDDYNKAASTVERTPDAKNARSRPMSLYEKKMMSS